MKIANAMSSQVVTVAPETSAAFAFMEMMRYRFRHLPVVDSDGTLWGIVSRSDLREALRLKSSDEQLTLEHFESSAQVKELCRKKIVTIDPDEDVKEAARIMIQNKIGALPVVKGKKLVGIITETDILSVFVEMMGYLAKSNEVLINLPDADDSLRKAMDALKAQGVEVLGVSMSKGRKKGTKDYSFRIQGSDMKKLRKRLSDIGFSVLSLR